MTKVAAIFIMLTAILLIGCKKDSCKYTYTLINNTEHRLQVSAQKETTDTVFQLSPNSEQLIIYLEDGVGCPDDIETVDTMWSRFDVLKDDTVPAISDFRIRSKWAFQVFSNRKCAYIGQYITEVTESDF